MKDELDEVKEAQNEEQAEDTKEWKFDGVAHTQGEILIESDEYEIVIPEKKPIAHPVDKPKAKPTASKTAPAPKKKPDGNGLKFSLIAIFVAICIVVLGVLGNWYYNTPNSDERMNPGNVAMRISDTDVSIGMYNYYYTCVVQKYITYAQYGYYQDLDPSVDFSQQKTVDEDGNEITWADMFKKDTIDQLKYITVLYEQAVKSGVTLTSEQKETIKTQLDSLKTTASEQNVSVDQYIKDTYGDFCGYATLEKMIEQCLLAENYYQRSTVESTATDKEIEEYFEENKDKYIEAPFAYLQVVFDGEEVTQKDAEKKAAKYAKQIKNVTDMKKAIPKACDELIAQYVGMGYFQNAKEVATALSAEIETSIKKDDVSFTKQATDWLFSTDTKTGDCSTFTDAEHNVVYIILKTGEADVKNDSVYSVRHILFMPKDKEGNALEDPTQGTKEQFAAAKKEAEKVLAEFNKGDKTEVSFAELAEKYSDDVQSTSKGTSGIYGGLCAGVRIGEMVKPFEEWSVDKSRKYGDVDIVKSQYGYHILFFVENTKSYLYECKQDVIADKENKMLDDAECKQHKKAMSKTKVQEPIAAAQGDPMDDDSDNMNY